MMGIVISRSSSSGSVSSWVVPVAPPLVTVVTEGRDTMIFTMGVSLERVVEPICLWAEMVQMLAINVNFGTNLKPVVDMIVMRIRNPIRTTTFLTSYKYSQIVILALMTSKMHQKRRVLTHSVMIQGVFRSLHPTRVDAVDL